MPAKACVPVTADAEGHNFVTECSFEIVLSCSEFAAHIQNVLLKLFPRTRDQSTKLLQEI